MTAFRLPGKLSLLGPARSTARSHRAADLNTSPGRAAVAALEVVR
jgi:hypothetical protein